MLLALKNTPETFQIHIDVGLLSVKWKRVLVYLHNIVILSKKVKNRTFHDEQFLVFINGAKLLVKLKK